MEAIKFKDTPFWSPLKCSEHFLKQFFFSPYIIYTRKVDPKVATYFILHAQALACVSLEGP